MAFRLAVALVIAAFVGPAYAKPVPTPTPVATSALAPAAAPLSAEQALAIREAVDASEASLRADAYGQFQVVSGLFGVLITVLIIAFSFQTQRTAGIEAANAARDEMTKAKARIEELHAEAARATEEAKKATEAANAAAESAAAANQKAEAAAAAAHEKREAVEADAKATKKNERETAAIFERMKSGPESIKPLQLTPEEVSAVTIVTEASAATPESQWSIDQFKTAIGKAMYIDKDLTDALRLTDEMEKIHGANMDARLYALNRRGDADIELLRFGEALPAYQAALAITTSDPPTSQLQDYIAAAHGAAYCLSELGRAPEAEKMLRGLLLVSEKVDGPEASSTLATRHNLAFAVLDQGRSDDAEAMLRNLLPICESVDGAEAPETLVTHLALARAILNQGHVAEAMAILRDLLPIRERVDGRDASGTLTTRVLLANALIQNGDVEGGRASLAAIPDPVTNRSWLPRDEAELAFSRGRLADAMGDPQAADAHLARAAEIFASIYPEDHNERRQLKAYRDNRPARKDAPDA